MKRYTPSFNNPWFVTVLMTALSVLLTWPLARVMTTEVASDLGDPVFNCWIMMWTGGQVLRFLKGDWSALGNYWNGNIFYPERLTIAYSEHLTPQMLQILPIYAATGNMVLCYNLLFLSALVLCGLGMYLLVRELTGQPVAAFVAGVAFAFSPYRVDQFAHLQVMGSQWMPLALYGFRRYFVGGRLRALVGATAAVVVQVLSCFYYLFFFAPFAAAYCLYEMVAQNRWRNRRMWLQLSVAGIVALLVIAPFLTPYLEVRAETGVGVRTPNEVAEFAADTWSLATATENLTFWGPRLQTFSRAEGNGFPGLTILALGLLGAVTIVWAAAARARQTSARPTPLWRRAAAIVCALAALILAVSWGILLYNGPGVGYLFGNRITMRDPEPIAIRTAVLAGVVLLFPGVRRFLRGVPRSASGFLLVGWVLAVLFAFGPEIRAHGKDVIAGPYLLLYKYIPGVNGMRVPSRFFMVATLFLTSLAGIGLAAVIGRWRRVGYALAALAVCGIAVESAITPFVTNRRLWAEHYELPPRHLATESTMGPVYQRVRDLPEGTVLAEFPYGSPPFDIQSVFYAGLHRKPLINGFSGFFPNSFMKRFPTIAFFPVDPQAAWQTLVTSGVTHVIVHEGAFFEGKGARISAWLRAAGARELVVNGQDHLFALK